MLESKSSALTNLATPLHRSTADISRPPINRRWVPIPPGDEPPNCRTPALASPPERPEGPDHAPSAQKPHCPSPSSALSGPASPAIRGLGRRRDKAFVR